MRTGDAITTTHLVSSPPGTSNQFTYKPDKGQRFVVLLLGQVAADGSEEFDANEALKALGWNPPEGGSE